MTNIELASRLLSTACGLGTAEFVVCSGSRNSPLVAVLSAARETSLFTFFEERSAAFFALGRCRRLRTPVAVITTSGTAASELLPAAIEAYYGGIPLLLITADRPHRFRGSGAPQSIEQTGLFGTYAPTIEFDIEAFPLVRWERRGPLHLNVAFDEPLIDHEVRPVTLRPVDLPEASSWRVNPSQSSALHNFLASARRPVVIVGELAGESRTAVREFVLRLDAPVYAEPLSGLREDAELQRLSLRSGERVLAAAGFDAVLHVGRVPALRFWRDLEDRFAQVPVLHVNDLPFSGLSRGSILEGPPGAVLGEADSIDARPSPDILAYDRDREESVVRTLEGEPRSEPAMIRQLSKVLPEDSTVFLGNSLPIREWDLAAVRNRRFDLAANRGANGIDGELSTFFGFCRSGDNAAIVGDLTALYDLSSPWVVDQLHDAADFRLFIINNGGGRIFSRVSALHAIDSAIRERLFENPHRIGFEGWARMWSLEYHRWEDVLDPGEIGTRSIIELRPDPAATSRVWRSLDAIWSGT